MGGKRSPTINIKIALKLLLNQSLEWGGGKSASALVMSFRVGAREAVNLRINLEDVSLPRKREMRKKVLY